MKTLPEQNGFVLFMTLIVMVLMSIAGLAMLRAVDNSTLVAGNIGYKQAAIISADSAVKVAADYMAAADLTHDGTANSGFYATNNSLDWTGQVTATGTDDIDWDGTNSAAPTKATPVTFANGTATDASGNQAYYVINRLCDMSGPSGALGTSCATSNSHTAATGSTKSGSSYGQDALTTTSQVYYRITVKVIGPKNSGSYSQVFVLI